MVGGLSWGEFHVNIQAAPPPEEVYPRSRVGVRARAAGGAWQSALSSFPSAWLGCPQFCSVFIFLQRSLTQRQ